MPFQVTTYNGAEILAIQAPVWVGSVRSMLRTAAREMLKDKPFHLWNDPTDLLLTYDETGEPAAVQDMTPSMKAATALTTVIGYLQDLEADYVDIVAGIDVDFLKEKQAATQRAAEDEFKSGKWDGTTKSTYIQFLDDAAWRSYIKMNPSPGGSSPESTEGETTPPHKAKTRDRVIRMNKANHTVAAVVHEVFHVIEGDGTDELGMYFVEACCEYLTCEALGGIDLRWAKGYGKDAPAPVYQKNLRNIRKAVAQQELTKRDIHLAFFASDKTALEKVFDKVGNN
ncbi:hypothetical protein AB0D74_08780 [Streptomyces sp. NPDC048278]|uniref:hypothetical protein n=1 Tax=Streptomyces sp. NPDC048278 TaxID=3155809 RepID=UPI00343CED86